MTFKRLAIAALLFATPAFAGSATGTFNVTATVLNNCSLSTSDLAFGNYSATSATPNTASTSLAVTCTSALPYTVALDGGNTAANVSARTMSDGSGHTLSYGLYTTGTYATIWGDGTGTTSTQAGTGNGSAQSLTVYGKIPAGQYVKSGSYTDRITVTVAY